MSIYNNNIYINNSVSLEESINILIEEVNNFDIIVNESFKDSIKLFIAKIRELLRKILMAIKKFIMNEYSVFIHKELSILKWNKIPRKIDYKATNLLVFGSGATEQLAKIDADHKANLISIYNNGIRRIRQGYDNILLDPFNKKDYDEDKKETMEGTIAASKEYTYEFLQSQTKYYNRDIETEKDFDSFKRIILSDFYHSDWANKTLKLLESALKGEEKNLSKLESSFNSKESEDEDFDNDISDIKQRYILNINYLKNLVDICNTTIMYSTEIAKYNLNQLKKCAK